MNNISELNTKEINSISGGISAEAVLCLNAAFITGIYINESYDSWKQNISSAINSVKSAGSSVASAAAKGASYLPNKEELFAALATGSLLTGITSFYLMGHYKTEKAEEEGTK